MALKSLSSTRRRRRSANSEASGSGGSTIRGAAATTCVAKPRSTPPRRRRVRPGRVTRKMEPIPGVLSTWISPESAVTRSLTMDRPRPMPPARRSGPPSTWKNGTKTCRGRPGRCPGRSHSPGRAASPWGSCVGLARLRWTPSLTKPARVNFRALATRLLTISNSLTSSTSTCDSPVAGRSRRERGSCPSSRRRRYAGRWRPDRPPMTSIAVGLGMGGAVRKAWCSRGCC